MPRFGRAYPMRAGQRQYRQIAYDATGGGATNGSGFATSLTTTWSHIATGPVLVGFDFRSGSVSTAGAARTVTYGGMAMTQLGVSNFSFEQGCDIWGLINPPAGSQTVSVTVSNVGAGNTGWGFVGNSVSYTGVGAFGAATTNSGSGTAASLTVPSRVGEAVSMVFGVAQSGQTAYNQTSRYNVLTGDSFNDLLIGDAPGTSSVSFSSTISFSNPWGAVGVRLIPRPYWGYTS